MLPEQKDLQVRKVPLERQVLRDLQGQKDLQVQWGLPGKLALQDLQDQ